MASRAILDSSPIVPSKSAAAVSGIPPPKRSLKRSASVASLPTPPQTDRHDRYAHSRSRSRGGTDRETDTEESESGSDYTEKKDSSKRSGKRRTSNGVVRLNFGRKKQRTDRLDETIGELTGQDAENPFWDGPTGAKKKGPFNKAVKDVITEETEAESEVEVPDSSVSPEVPAVLKFRNRSLISPPPSHRQSARRARAAVAPRTPEPATSRLRGRTSARTGPHPIRDSPNNPFLEDSPDSVAGEPIEPHTPTEVEEKPTISYVFRGVRTEYPNPLFGLSPSVHERSMLPVTHPDFSPTQACPPKLLFPEVQRRRRQPRTVSPSPTRATAKRARTSYEEKKKEESHDEWSDDEGELKIEPPKQKDLSELRTE